MNLALFGATGGTGRETLKQALAQGDAVTALVRTPSKLDITHDQLTIVEGDVLDQGAVDQVVAGQDAVIISLGNTPNNPDLVVSKGTRHILDAMHRFGVRRTVVVTAIGVGDSRDHVPLAFKMLMRTVLKKAYEDKEIQEQDVRSSGLDWIIVRPGGLTDGPATGDYTVGQKVKTGQVSRADVAEFVLKQVTDDTYLHQTPSIA